MDIEANDTQPERLDRLGLNGRASRLLIERHSRSGELLALGAIGE